MLSHFSIYKEQFESFDGKTWMSNLINLISSHLKNGSLLRKPLCNISYCPGFVTILCGESCICIFLMCITSLLTVGEGRNLINNHNTAVPNEREFKNYIKNLILRKILILIYFK